MKDYRSVLIVLGLAMLTSQAALALDSDGDGVDDPSDNCSYAHNADQANADADPFGDACDADADADGVIDRPPNLFAPRQTPNTNRFELLWGGGNGAAGRLDPNVESYTVERRLGSGAFAAVATGDHHTMTHGDAPAALAARGRSRRRAASDPYTYRIKVATSGGLVAYSNEQTVVLASPLYPLDEALDGKVRLKWASPWIPPAGYTTIGHQVQRRQGGKWVDAHSGVLSEQTFVDTSGTVLGLNRYRVRAVFYRPQRGKTKYSSWSNTQELEVNATCAGQALDPQIPPLTVVTLNEGPDPGTDYDGDDIVAGLEQCGALQYEFLDGIGDDDGVCEAGESCVMGGCVLRALPVTYDNVAIMITSVIGSCDDAPGAPPSEWNDVTHPTHCLLAGPGLALDFPAGLVIEGYGSETVFRSPLWQPPYLPAPILEVHRQSFPVTLRNLVLDGRKHEQVPPAARYWADWHYGGLKVWNESLIQEIDGDFLGADDMGCNSETCTETPGGDNDGDLRCEAGEMCVEDNAAPGGNNDGVCETDLWPDAVGCESQLDDDDGCIHNVEVRNTVGVQGVSIENANRWIIEDSEIRDAGCVNRGFGFDCPYFDSAPDLEGFGGFKTYGTGLSVGDYTSDFQIRRNEVHRTVKYGMSFKNGNAATCNGLLRNHEIASNDLHDLGTVGIYNHGSVGARIHHNTIDRTTVWNEPEARTAYENAFGVSLGGLCTDDNEFFDNVIKNTAGVGIYWNGATETTQCDAPGSCAPVADVGNTIRDNTIDGTCLEKETAPGATYQYVYGSLIAQFDASGPLLLKDNTLTNSQCRSAISAFGRTFDDRPWVKALDLRVEGGSYESGPNAASNQFFYCGAVHAFGDNRKIVLGDGVKISNPAGVPMIPKGCVFYSATLVVDDVPVDPFAAGQFSDFQAGHEGAAVVQCSSQPSHPDCQ